MKYIFLHVYTEAHSGACFTDMTGPLMP